MNYKGLLAGKRGGAQLTLQSSDSLSFIRDLRSHGLILPSWERLRPWDLGPGQEQNELTELWLGEGRTQA